MESFSRISVPPPLDPGVQTLGGGVRTPALLQTGSPALRPHPFLPTAGPQAYSVCLIT